MIGPDRPCPECGSHLFYRKAGVFKCAKHERPTDVSGLQFYVTKGAEVWAKALVKAFKAFKEEAVVVKSDGSTVTKSEVEQEVAKALGPRLNLKSFSGQHPSVTAVKAMTGRRSIARLPSTGRDAHGRVTKSEEEEESDEVVRDFFGRRRRKA